MRRAPLRHGALLRRALACTLIALAAAPATAGADPNVSPELVPFTGTRQITATWGAPSGGYHAYPAVDIALPMGSPVYAAGAGTIVASSTGCPSNGTACGIENLGNMIRIAHPDGRNSRYGHMSSLVVGSGNVSAGQLIGYSGSSGISTGPHLHYQETNGASYGAAVDPGVWVACHGATRVDYGNLQARVGQTVRNDGYGCGGSVGDGGLIRTPDGHVYRIVGGAPLWISRCDYTAGCAGVVNVANLAGYAAHPRDGALVGNVDDGGIYRFAGGAPLWISSCDYAPGCGGVVQVDGYPFAVNDHMRDVPADGTLIGNVRDKGIYRFAGGAPLWISSCDYAPGCGGPITQLDGGTFDTNGAISGAKRIREVPADGTLIGNARDKGIYRFAGGAPLWISSCDYAPGCGGPITQLDGGTFDTNGSLSGAKRIRQFPAPGTYLKVGGAQHRAAGGALLRVTDCGVLDGKCQPSVTIDGGTVSKKGALSGGARLRDVPEDGTVVQGRPSNLRWVVAGGVRSPSPSGSGGVQINDATVDAIPTPTIAVAGVQSDPPVAAKQSAPGTVVNGAAPKGTTAPSSACAAARRAATKRWDALRAARRSLARATTVAKRRRARSVVARRRAAWQRASALRTRRCG